VLYPNFVDAARCEHVIALARSKLVASGLAWRPDETPDPQQQTRTSDGAFLAAEEDKGGVLAWLERKIAAVTMLPTHYGEVRFWGGGAGWGRGA
jgi:prolyl 4-hydroxylase